MLQFKAGLEAAIKKACGSLANKRRMLDSNIIAVLFGNLGAALPQNQAPRLPGIVVRRAFLLSKVWQSPFRAYWAEFVFASPADAEALRRDGDRARIEDIGDVSFRFASNPHTVTTWQLALSLDPNVSWEVCFSKWSVTTRSLEGCGLSFSRAVPYRGICF